MSEQSKELAEARETIRRLNRRCQSAERGLAEKLEEARRAGPSLGRALANSSATMHRAQNAELTARLRHLEEENARLKDVKESQAIPRDQWHDDDGAVLWWDEAEGGYPYVGSPLDSDWDEEAGYTHFTRIPNPIFGTGGAGRRDGGGTNGAALSVLQSQEESR